MKKFFQILFLTVLLATGIAHAEPAKSLKIASTLPADITATIASGFTRATGLPVDVVYLPQEKFVEQLNHLYKKNIDCVVGPNQDDFYLAERANMLVPYISRQLSDLPVQTQPRKGMWTNLWVDYLGFLSNTESLHDLGLFAPEGWIDLIVKNLKDEIVLEEYEISPTVYSGIVSMWQVQGETAALNFAHEFNKQKIKFVSNREDAVKEIMKGKKAVTILPLSKALTLEKQAPNLYASVIMDANRCLYSGVGIMRGTKSPEDAQRFVDYLLSEEFTNWTKDAGIPNLWHIRLHNADARRFLIGEAKLTIDDLGWTSLSKKEIIKQWKKA